MGNKENLYVVLFSGGRTSAFLSKYIKENEKYKNKIFIFCNTGKEREETLQFVDKCDKEFNLNVIWLEAVITKTKGIGTKHKIVNFKTASRNGEPFEMLFNKYNLPTVLGAKCTSELKEGASNSYLKQFKKEYNIIKIIGIRSDEKHRKSINAEKKGFIYPLIDELQADNKFIRNYWARQTFDLNLKDYEGNCDLCFKKSLKKRLTIIKENPQVALWWKNMEEKYGNDTVPRFDLRNNLSIEELINLSQKKFTKAVDLHELSQKQKEIFDEDMDCFCKSN